MYSKDIEYTLKRFIFLLDYLRYDIIIVSLPLNLAKGFIKLTVEDLWLVLGPRG